VNFFRIQRDGILPPQLGNWNNDTRDMAQIPKVSPRHKTLIVDRMFSW